MRDKDWEISLKEQIPRLRRYARALTQNASLADDLVQDCLERAWDKRHTWREESNVRAWLFSIMHNVFINSVRRNKLAADYMDHLQQSSPQQGSDRGYLVRDLEVCLSRLRVEFREVVLLAGLEGLSYKEISKVIDVPVGTVMSRLSRGREELRALMSDEAATKVVPIK